MSSVQHTVSLSQPYPDAALGHIGIIKRALVQVHPMDLQRDPFVLSASRLTIGRDSACDLAIADPSVSRHHAELRLTDQGAVLLDLGSTNGVSVNGNRVETHVLTSGDHIQIGSHLFRFLATADDLEPLYLSTVYSMLTRDGLTRVFNRRYLMETLQREVARCDRHARPIALIVIDVDQFAGINVRFGMLIGDQVLRQVARRLENILREEDVLARTTGNRFAVAMVEATLEDAVEIAERCRLNVGSEPVVTSVGPIPVTISLGIASRPGRSRPVGETQQARPSQPTAVQAVIPPRTPSAHSPRSRAADELLTEATERLVEAKRGGRNRTVC